MSRNPGKSSSYLIVVDGTPRSGVGTLAEALYLDLELFYNERARYPEIAGSFEALKEVIRAADAGPMIAPRLLLTPAARMNEANTRWGGPCVTPEEWSVLDAMVARRNGRLLCLVDTPVSIQARIPEAVRDEWPRERLGGWLTSVNRALECSTVARKGSYILPQFFDLKTGEKTAQYWRLVEVIRREIEATRGADVGG